jgi:hypothetical protein
MPGIFPTIERVQVIRLVQGHNPQQDRIMFMPERMGMFIKGIIMATFSKGITANGVLVQVQVLETEQAVSSR